MVPVNTRVQIGHQPPGSRDPELLPYPVRVDRLKTRRHTDPTRYRTSTTRRHRTDQLVPEVRLDEINVRTLQEPVNLALGRPHDDHVRNPVRREPRDVASPLRALEIVDQGRL